MAWKRSDAGPCECQWLEHAALESDIPIIFNPRLREYHLVHGASSMPLYYCPFCGGSAPESARGSLFAYVPQAEYTRLGELTRGITTLADAFRILGPPDRDHLSGAGVISPDLPDQPRVAENFRLVVYESLSSTAEVHVLERNPERVTLQFIAKYVGPPPDDPNAAA
jgi:hypothetical protein